MAHRMSDIRVSRQVFLRDATHKKLCELFEFCLCIQISRNLLDECFQTKSSIHSTGQDAQTFQIY